MHGQFIREMPEKVDKDRKWQWLSKNDLKIGTEALLSAAQEQAIMTNYVKHHIDKTSESTMCRLCGKSGERVQHLGSGCEKWPRENIMEHTTMLQRKSTGTSARRMGQNTQKNGINTSQREQQKMKK